MKKEKGAFSWIGSHNQSASVACSGWQDLQGPERHVMITQHREKATLPPCWGSVPWSCRRGHHFQL